MLCIFSYLSLSSTFTYMQGFYYFFLQKLNYLGLGFQFCSYNIDQLICSLNKMGICFSFEYQAQGGWSKTGEAVLFWEVILESKLLPSCSSTILGGCFNHIFQGGSHHVCIPGNRKGKGWWQGRSSFPVKSRFSKKERSLLIILPWP